MHLRLIVTVSEADPARVVHAVSTPISREQKRFQAFVEVTVPPGAEGIHTYSFSGWAIQNVPFEFHAQRYSEGIQVRVTNRVSQQITCAVSKGTNNPTLPRQAIETRAIPSGDTVTLKQGLVLDGNRDNVQFVFHT